MPRVIKRSASQAVKAGRSRRDVPLPHFISPQLSRPVEKPPSGPQWVHEIKLDGFRVAARIDNGRVQLLTRTGLDWTAKYPGAITALANLNVKTAYIEGELCGVDEAGLPSFAHTQAATDGERGAHLVYYAFDLLHLAGWDFSSLPLVRRKELSGKARPPDERDAHTLSDFRVPTLSIECEPCGRRGRYNVAKLMGKCGDRKLPELRHVLANCPKAHAHSIHDRCRVKYGEAGQSSTPGTLRE
jgi:hypothetical protein